MKLQIKIITFVEHNLCVSSELVGKFFRLLYNLTKREVFWKLFVFFNWEHDFVWAWSKRFFCCIGFKKAYTEKEKQMEELMKRIFGEEKGS